MRGYRIGQEALTNVLRHAGPATHVTVSLIMAGERLRILARDTGGPTVQLGEEGQGLAGAHERASLHGDTVVAGPAPDGGWVIEAVLLIDPDDQP